MEYVTLAGHSVVAMEDAERLRGSQAGSVSLRPLLESVLTGTGELLAPALVGLIGLRYINRFVDGSAGSPAAWKGRLHDQLLGPICHPILGDRLIGAQQQVELKLGEAQGAIIRHGRIVDPAAGGAISPQDKSREYEPATPPQL